MAETNNSNARAEEVCACARDIHEAIRPFGKGRGYYGATIIMEALVISLGAIVSATLAERRNIDTETACDMTEKLERKLEKSIAVFLRLNGISDGAN